jgi:hypothetical protein
MPIKEIAMSQFEDSFSGMNLRPLLQIARELGCAMYFPRRTGELVVSHYRMVRRVRINARRTDAPRALSTFLKQVARLMA